MSNYKEVDIKRVKDATYIGIWTNTSETSTPDIKVQLETHTRTDTQEHDFDNVPEIFYGEFYPKNNNDARFGSTTTSPIPAYKFQDNVTQSVIIKVLLPKGTEQICFYNGDQGETALCDIITFYEQDEATTTNAPFSDGNALLRYTLTSNDQATLEVDLHTACNKSHQEDTCFIANDLKNDNFVSHDMLIKNTVTEGQPPFQSGQPTAWQSRIINGNVVTQDLQLYYCGNLMYKGEDVIGTKINYNKQINRNPITVYETYGWAINNSLLYTPAFKFESAIPSSDIISLKLILQGKIYATTQRISSPLYKNLSWNMDIFTCTWLNDPDIDPDLFRLRFSYNNGQGFIGTPTDLSPYLTIYYDYSST